MREELSLRQEVREALAWVTFALTYTFLPEHLRGRLHFPPPLAVAFGVWVGGVLLILIEGRREPKQRKTALLFVTAVCVIVYVAGTIFHFPK